MENNDTNSKQLPMSEETRKRLQAVSDQLKGKVLFPEALARAKALFSGLTNSTPTTTVTVGAADLADLLAVTQSFGLHRLSTRQASYDKLLAALRATGHDHPIPCTAPTDGWYCNGSDGHDGPCAARKVKRDR